MTFSHLIDGPSALIVFGGTLLATLLRCGRDDARATLAMLRHVAAGGFAADAVRAALAPQVRRIVREGVLRIEPHATGDEEFDAALDALVRQRSRRALAEVHDTFRTVRRKRAGAAVRTLAQACELAPVFGLAGTLISLAQMPVEGITKGGFTSAIAMAVLTTLYGLLAANVLLGPLSRMVDRAADAEEDARDELANWVAEQVAQGMPPERATGEKAGGEKAAPINEPLHGPLPGEAA